MSTGYQIYNQENTYYLTFQVVDWVDIFTRKIYRDILIESFDYCRNNKWMLKRFEFAAKSHQRNSEYQFWYHDNHAIELSTHDFTCQKLAYIHLNPVRSGLVENAEDWLYSSARNYLGMEHLLDIDVMDL